MSVVDLHPEDLIEREARGMLLPGERQRLDEHRAHCSACAFERVVSLDFAHAVSGAVASGIASEAPPIRLPWRDVAGWRGSRVARAAAAGAVLVLGAVAAAALLSGGRPSPSGAVREVAGPAPSGAAADLPGMPAMEEPAAPELRRAAPPPVVAQSEGRSLRARGEEAGGSGPMALFVAANHARRGGRTTEAVRLYRELQRRFAGSQEELLSRAILGRLLLDRLADPAGALRLFDSYLAANPSGTLVQEAMVGRALGLQQLGRAVEERDAWRAMLERFPGSVYAGRARSRIEVLR